MAKNVINLASNNYSVSLRHPKLREAAIQAVKNMASARRWSGTISGTMTLHMELESASPNSRM